LEMATTISRCWCCSLSSTTSSPTMR
jgi:hypothetical protein